MLHPRPDNPCTWPFCRGAHGGAPATGSAPRGFTLVEMLGALLLTALLMTALMSVIVTVQRPLVVAGGDTAPPPPWVDHALYLIRQDLTNARSFQMSGGQLVVTGYRSVMPAQSTIARLPVVITYQVQKVDGQAYLFRRQHLLVKTAHLPDQVELVAAGVINLAVQPITPLPKPTNPPPATGQHTGVAMDGQWRIQLDVVTPAQQQRSYTCVWTRL